VKPPRRDLNVMLDVILERAPGVEARDARSLEVLSIGWSVSSASLRLIRPVTRRRKPAC